ncbi:hypothetical protein, partial [Mesorhizobium sp. M7A.T.Ca.US.000.02.1.1]|uniref:hypothetical protein n=1 Tax=Mesorhizobium sp. M7A.T.Ca.US.000.02.1.1 TaxID=2496792 RepID=UPI0019D450F3
AFNNAATAQARADKGVADASAAQSTANSANAAVSNLDKVAVKYTGPDRSAVNIGGQMKGVSNGTAGTDAVNLNQLNGVGVVATQAKTQADKGVADAATAQATANQVGTDLAALDARAVQFGADGAIQGKGARLANLGDGVEASDAVTRRQLDALAGEV